MVRIWILGCLCLHLALASVKAQPTTPGFTLNYNNVTGGNYSAGYTYIASANVNLGLDQVAQACASVAASITGHANAWQNNFGAMMGNQLVTMSNSVIAANAIAASLNAVNTNYSALVGSANLISASAANIAGNVATMSSQFPPMVTGMNTLSAQLSAFRASVTNAIATAGSGTEAAAQLATNIGPRLEIISDILRTNQTSISINTTNGETALNVTNIIQANIEVPALTNLDQYLIDVQNGKDPVDAARNQVPSNYALERSKVESASPFLGITMPGVTDLGALTVPANFMRVQFAKPSGGGTWDFDFNPMTHMGGSITAFRAGLTWILLVGFLYACGKIAQDAVLNMGSATQAHSPDVSILGNNAGLAIGILYVGIFIVASAALTAAMAYVVDKTLFTQLATNPYAGFGTDGLILANMFFPLAATVSQGIWLLSAKWIVVAESWVFNAVTRSLPA